MSDKLKPKADEISIIYDGSELQKMQEFSRILNSAPPKNSIQVNKFANNSKYLPISFIESKLDTLFFGQWQTANFRTQQIGNEIVGAIELRVVHPVTGKEIVREGAGAVQIQFQKGSDFTNYNNKIQNTLTKDYPHLKAECVKNAAKTLGKFFGRDLNRQHEDTYVNFIRDDNGTKV